MSNMEQKLKGMSGTSAMAFILIMIISFFWFIVILLYASPTAGMGTFLTLFGYCVNFLLAAVAIAHDVGVESHSMTPPLHTYDEEIPTYRQPGDVDVQRTPS